MQLARAFGVFDATGVTVAVPNPASTTELERAHDGRYIGAMQQASAAGQTKPDAAALFQYGLGTEDDPMFPGMHEAAALVTGATGGPCLGGPSHPGIARRNGYTD